MFKFALFERRNMLQKLIDEVFHLYIVIFKNLKFIDLFSSYTCLCGTNYSGKYCETSINQCNSSFCLNNGICIVDSTFNQPLCLCQYGYTGKNCQQSINFCSNSPCLNGGNCTSLSFGYRCDCSLGFYG